MKIGDRVKIVKPRQSWTETAKRNLPDTCGVITKERPDCYFTQGRYLLVEFDKPVKVNPISSFTCAWMMPEELETINQ